MVVLLTGLTLGHFVAPYMVAQTNDPANQLRRLGAQFTDPSEAGLAFDSFSLKTHDSLILKALFIPASSPEGTIIMLHGIRAYKEHFIQIAPMIVAHGYNVVLLDNRAHGQSEGRFCTFGVKEKEDVGVLIDTLNQMGISKNIGVWGQSLGGAIALQSMAYDKRISFGIIESTFTEFRLIADDYFVRFMPFVPRWYRSYIINRGAKLAHFNPEEASVLNATAEVTAPVFLAHGTADNRINVKYANANFNSLASSKKELHLVEGATHVNVWNVGGGDYFKAVFNFLESLE